MEKTKKKKEVEIKVGDQLNIKQQMTWGHFLALIYASLRQKQKHLK